MNPEQRNRSKSLPAIQSIAPTLQQKGLRRRPTPNPSTTGVVTPTLSVKESTNLLELTAELPGIQPSDVQVEIRRNVLWLAVVKTEEGSEKTLGTFSEAFRLPEDVDLASMKTIGTDGKFVVTMTRNPSVATTEMQM